MNNPINYLLILVMTAASAFGSFFLKRGSSSATSIISMIKCKWLWLGGVLYLGSAVLTIYLLRVLPYSVVVPVGAVTYIWTMIISHFLLGEKITRQKLIGILFVLAGVVLVAL